MITNSAIMVPSPAPGGSPAPALQFHEALKPMIEIPNPWLWAICLGSILALCLIGWLLWRWWKNKAAIAKVAPIVPPHVRARRALDAALALIADPKAFSVAVSGAIRGYLEERFNFHAPDRTTEEFLYELQNTNLLTVEQKASLGNFLANCDLIKFAKYEPAETELRTMHDAARRLVDETEPHWDPDVPQSATTSAK